MSIGASEQGSSGNRDQLVLVHGTYAGRDQDDGDSWWQVGSETAHELEQRLPSDARMAESGEVFHWSGENSERARIKAAHELVDHLDGLENRARGYHLIGHSHGGSVIWHALRLATLQGKKLKGLKTWATVGTPFLHHRTRGAWNVVNLLNIILALVLLKPAYVTGCGLFRIVIGPWFGWTGAGRVSAADVPEQLSFFKSPVLKVMDLVGLTVTASSDGLRIGSFDPARGDSFYEYLFLTPEGWLMLLIALGVIYVYLNLGGFFLGPVLESLRIRAEKRLERDAMEAYGDLWLGVWSPDDEAINGLRATLDLSVSFVSRMTPRERVLFSDHLSLLSRPYYWVLAPVFNRLIRPIVDGAVRSLVVKTAQGNNRPAAEVIKVSPLPSENTDPNGCPPIPLWLNRKLVDEADRYASELGPNLRRLLAQPSFVSGLEAFSGSLQGKELIHTSYFDHGEILDLLVLHMAWHGNAAQWRPFSRGKEDRLVRWLTDAKWRAVGRGTVEEPDVRIDPPLGPIPAGKQPVRRQASASSDQIDQA